MSKMNKLPDNVIPVDFKNSKILSRADELCSNPFSIFIDDHCLDPDEFSKALLSQKDGTKIPVKL